MNIIDFQKYKLKRDKELHRKHVEFHRYTVFGKNVDQKEQLEIIEWAQKEGIIK
jgi:hypothetical protein